MLRAIQTRLEFKILLLLIAVLLVGFGTYAILTIQQQSVRPSRFNRALIDGLTSMDER